ncbi:MAG: hypothetical protein II695_04255, partial [Oscillospiraceae bacterium]|nr:hypothetical protein [Oscillospiraceae bacterium]
MEVLNKILPLILTAIMSVNLSGCGNSTGANGSQTAETDVSINTVSTESVSKATDTHEGYRIATYDEIVKFDIQDHSYDEFKSSLYIDGILLSVPCKISDLDEHIKFDDGGLGPGLIYDNGEFVQRFADVKEENDVIKYVYINDFAFSDYTISINGLVIKPETELSKIEKCFGKENRQDIYRQ